MLAAMRRTVRETDGWHWQRLGLRGRVSYGPFRSRWRAWVHYWFGAERAPGRVVRCQMCVEGRPHYYHWFGACTCAAGGAYEDHSHHCVLAGATLAYDDSLLVDAP